MSTLTLGQVFSSAPINLDIQALGSVSGALSVDLSAGAYISATATGATAWTFSIADSTAATKSCAWDLQITDGGTTQTFAVLVDGFASTPVKWASGTAPSLTSSGTDILRFVKGADNYVVGYRIATNVS